MPVESRSNISSNKAKPGRGKKNHPEGTSSYPQYPGSTEAQHCMTPDNIETILCSLITIGVRALFWFGSAGVGGNILHVDEQHLRSEKTAQSFGLFLFQ